MKSIFKTSLLALALILLVPCNSKAQADNKEIDNSAVVNAYRKDVELNIQLKNKLDALKEINNRLRKELKQAQNENKALVKDSLELQSMLNVLKLKKDKSGVSVLALSERQLLESNDSVCQQIEIVKKQIAELDSQLAMLGAQGARLEAVKTEVGEKIIGDNHSYLDLSFSKMTLSRLNEIRSECMKYMVDEKVNKFVALIDCTIKNKMAYDEAVDVLANRFDKKRVLQCVSSLKKLKGQSETQKMETISTLNSLSVFEEGTNVLREFAKKFKKERERGMSAVQDCKDALSFILDSDNMVQRIKDKVRPVFYLNKMYNEYCKSIMKNFKTPTTIENEILGE